MNKVVTFSSPIDASKKIAGGDPACPGFALITTHYQNTPGYLVQLQNADGSFAAQVIGINVDTPSEATVTDDVRADIAATLS